MQSSGVHPTCALPISDAIGSTGPSRRKCLYIKYFKAYGAQGDTISAPEQCSRVGQMFFAEEQRVRGRLHRRALGVAAQLFAYLLRAIKHPAGSFDRGLSLFDLPLQRLGRLLDLLDKLAPALNGVRRFA